MDLRPTPATSGTSRAGAGLSMVLGASGHQKPRAAVLLVPRRLSTRTRRRRRTRSVRGNFIALCPTRAAKAQTRKHARPLPAELAARAALRASVPDLAAALARAAARRPRHLRPCRLRLRRPLHLPPSTRRRSGAPHAPSIADAVLKTGATQMTGIWGRTPTSHARRRRARGDHAVRRRLRRRAQPAAAHRIFAGRALCRGGLLDNLPMPSASSGPGSSTLRNRRRRERTRAFAGRRRRRRTCRSSASSRRSERADRGEPSACTVTMMAAVAGRTSACSSARGPRAPGRRRQPFPSTTTRPSASGIFRDGAKRSRRLRPRPARMTFAADRGCSSACSGRGEPRWRRCGA